MMFYQQDPWSGHMKSLRLQTSNFKINHRRFSVLFFETNGKGGDMVMTCENYDVLNPISGDSYVYDCGWATLKIEGNQVKIHFAPSTPDDVALTHEEIQISANDGDRKVYTLIGFSRVINEEGPTDPQPEGLPEEAKFKMIMSEYTPFMKIEVRCRHLSI